MTPSLMRSQILTKSIKFKRCHTKIWQQQYMHDILVEKPKVVAIIVRKLSRIELLLLLNEKYI